MDNAVANPGYGYTLEPIHRVPEGTHIGTMVYFEDFPVSVGRDVEMDYPRHAFFRFEDCLVVEELDHVVVKATADDEGDRITQAAYFAPAAKATDVAEFWARQHGFA